jgi:seryl-tRNA synthetase
MIDIKLIRDKKAAVKKALKSRGVDSKIIDEFLELDDQWRELTTKLDRFRSEQKRLGQERKITKAKALKKKIKTHQAKLMKLVDLRKDLLNRIPNLPLPSALKGKGEQDNKVLREVGKKPNFKFDAKDYLTIAENLDMIDMKRGAKVAGSRFSYLKNDAVLLELSLINYAFNLLVPKGFTPVIPPAMIKPHVFEGMGRLAADQKDERYYLPNDDLYLIGSGEHTIGPLHQDEILDEDQLPIRYVGFSPCFRREAGSYGKDTKGILRVHQFDKVEMFSFCRPEDSEKEHQLLLSLQEKIMKGLKLPYRVVEICTGDMGWTDAKQFDIETWMPGQDTYRETHSASNTTDFQARGVNVRFKRKKSQEIEHVHMLNATGLAIGRTIIALIENNQTKKGEVKMPKI